MSVDMGLFKQNMVSPFVEDQAVVKKNEANFYVLSSEGKLLPGIARGGEVLQPPCLHTWEFGNSCHQGSETTHPFSWGPNWAQKLN